MRKKLFLGIFWILTLVYALGGSFLLLRSFHAQLGQVRETEASRFTSAVDLLCASDFSLVKQVMERFGWETAVVTRNGETLYAVGAPEVLPEPENGTLQQSIRQRQLYTVGQTVYNGDCIQLQTAAPLSEVYDAQTALLRWYVLLLASALLVGGLLSWLLTRVLTKPLDCLVQATKQLSEGNFVRVPAAKDELGELSEHFNRMSAALQDGAERQERFLGSFTHELKTPMTSIIGYADLMQAQALTSEEIVAAAGFISANGRRLDVLAKKLLALLVIEQQPEFRPIDLSALVEKITTELRPVYAERGILLQTALSPRPMEGEPILLRSLLENLLDNAAKAMEGGGTVTVCLTKEALRVSDTGCGIPQEELSRLTEAFYCVDKSRARTQGGFGLGLALCQKIAELHGARLRFASEPGKGTTVTVQWEGTK